MDHRTQGVVLRIHPYSETSLIVRWLTPDLGRIATLARGASRPKSPFRGRLDICYWVDLTFTLSRRSTLHTLKEVSVRQSFPRLRQDYHALEQASYAIRILERVTEPDTPLPGLAPLLEQFLETTASAGNRPLALLAFEARLLEWSGQGPDPQTSRLEPGARALLTQLLQAPPDTLSRLCPSAPQIHSVRRFLGGCLETHLDIPPQWRPSSAAT